MNSLELVESFSEFKELKSIDKQTMQHVLEDVFRAMLKKKFNTDEHIDVIVNIEKGDVQIFLNKEIVQDGEVEDPNTEIAYSDAIKIEPDFEVGEEVKLTESGDIATVSSINSTRNSIIVVTSNGKTVEVPAGKAISVHAEIEKSNANNAKVVESKKKLA